MKNYLRLKYILTLVVIIVVMVRGITSCDDPLGLESRILPNSNITASTTKDNLHRPYEARLNGASSWCAKDDDTSSPWIQVSFGDEYSVSGLKIQGSKTEFVWVKKYRIEYKQHGGQWTKYPRNVQGNSVIDYPSGKRAKFRSVFIAHDIRVYPLEVAGISMGSVQTFSPCLRMELYGCRRHAQCRHPGLPPHSAIESINISHNGQARFRCDRGFTIIGPEVITCNNGLWTQALPVCKARCRHPGLPPHSTIESITDILHKGQARFRCDPGFTLIGPEVITCNNGQWTQALPVCRAQCPDPGTPSNGYRIGDIFVDKMAVRFTCNSTGFDLIGSSVVHCRKGKWSAATPECKARCSHPGIPTNGFLVEINVRHAGVVSYRCKQGFKLQGSPRIVCNNGKWNQRLPVCIVDDDDDDGSGSGSAARCSDPGIPVNGGRHASSFKEGESVLYFCGRGLVLFGHQKITCINGQWTGWVPQCKKLCKDPGTPLNGGRHGNNFAEGQYVTFFCNSGYDVIGQDNPMCIDGQWSSGRPVCKLQANKCPLPQLPPNVDIYGPKKQLYDNGDRVMYACSPGYFPYGPRIRVCRGRTWTNIRFQCIPKSCGDPGTPRNGYKTGLVYTILSKVHYHCYPAYGIHGESAIQCLVNATWSATKPQCRRIDCGYLPTPSNGAKEITSTTYGGVATFKCTRRGYTLVGSKTRKCQSNGRWTGTQPHCRTRSCSRLSAPLHGAVVLHGGYTYRSSVTFTCNKGYAMDGKARSVCLDDGTWSSTVPTCKRPPRRCPSNWIQYNGHCYLFKHRTRRAQTWKRLKSRCARANADLVDIHDNQEWNFVKGHLKTSVTFYVIGLRKSYGSWKWTTGSPVPHWVTAGIRTNSMCGALNGWSGQFGAVPCSNRQRAFICKM